MCYLLVLAVAELEISVSLLLVVQIVIYSYFGFGKILAVSLTSYYTQKPNKPVVFTDTETYVTAQDEHVDNMDPDQRDDVNPLIALNNRMDQFIIISYSDVYEKHNIGAVYYLHPFTKISLLQKNVQPR